ncbi:MAG: GNAT family N-acetyltransferase [Eubacteriales bacterium]|nr:GNAT family N-acetyltransferase [Eubacteriales bacterium]
MITKLQNPMAAKDLFAGWEETLIWSCLQKVMGGIYGDSAHDPASAMALIGDFCFLAGMPDTELAAYKPETCQQDFMIMVPQNQQWGELIEQLYQGKAKKVTRYAIKKEPDVFDKEKLRQMTDTLSPEYELKMIDEGLYHYCKEHTWCRDFVSQYADYEAYRKYGLGVVILKDGVPVSGASSYTSYPGGIEIEIDTKEEYRRRGLATICGAKLILECLQRNLYPSWDAQNLWSVSLAEKLGYHFDHVYTAYEICEY